MQELKKTLKDLKEFHSKIRDKGVESLSPEERGVFLELVEACGEFHCDYQEVK